MVVKIVTAASFPSHAMRCDEIAFVLIVLVL